MTIKSFERCLRTFTRQRPFRSFLIEFLSGDRITISHPETVLPNGDVFVFRTPDSGHRVFEAESVSQFIDPGRTT